MATKQVTSLRMEKKFKKTAAGEIPVEWEIAPLNGVATIIMGQSPPSSDYNQNGEGLPFYQGNADFGTKYPAPSYWCNVPAKIAKQNDILISVRAPVGKMNIAPHECCIGRGLAAVRAERVDKDYLYFAIYNALPQLRNVAQGSTFEAINSKELVNFQIPVPAVFEQKKIAEILSSVDDAIEKTDAVLGKTKQLKKGLMQKLLTRGLGHKKFKKTEIGEIPAGWEVATVGSIAELGRGRVISQKAINEHHGQYPVFSSQSKDKGVFGYLDTYDFEGEYVTWTTDGAYAGTVFYRNGKFNCTNVCGTIKAKSESSIDMKFLSCILSTRTTRYVSYVGNPKLMNNIMAEIPFPCPLLSEQKKIAEILSAMDDEVNMEENRRRQLEIMKKSLMQVLLTGKIRVNCK